MRRRSRTAVYGGSTGVRVRSGAYRVSECSESAARIRARARAAAHLCAIVLITGAVAVLAVWGLSEFAPGARSARPREYIEVTVAPGDTIWHIAKRVVGDSTDIRVVTHRILELNSMESPMIHPGQTILVPLDM